LFCGPSCISCISARLGPDEGRNELEDTQPEKAVQPESKKEHAKAIQQLSAILPEKLDLLIRYLLKIKGR